jgi:hypothetical protein
LKTIFNITQDIPTRIYLFLVFFGISLVFYSWLIAYPIYTNPNDVFGLGSHLPFIYWIGLGLLLICILLMFNEKKYKSNNLYLLVLLSVVISLFGVTVFALENPDSLVSYYPAAEVKTVLNQGHINADLSYPAGTYRLWPGIHFISASLILITGIDLLEIIRNTPILLVSIWGFLGYSIGQNINLRPRKCFCIAFLLILSCWVAWAHYLPQGIAFTFYLTIFGLVLIIRKNQKAVLLLVITSLALIITHALTSVMLVCAIVPVTLYRKNIGIAFIVVTMVLLWMVFYASPAFEQGVQSILTLPFFDLISTGQRVLSVTQRIIPRLISGLATLGYVAFFTMAIITSLLSIIGSKLYRVDKQMVTTCLLWIFGLILILPLEYGGELIWRIFWLATIPGSVIIAICLKYKQALIALFVFLLILHIPTHWARYSGGEAVYTSEICGIQFFAIKAKPRPPNSYFYARNNSLVNYFDPTLITTQWLDYQQTNWQAGLDNINKSTYIIMSQQTSSEMIFSFGQDPLSKWQDTEIGEQSNLIYNNGNFSLYKRNDPI